MTDNPNKPADVDDYIAGFPPEVRELLEKVRKAIRKAAPDAVETIKYGIPTYVLNGNLVSFAGYKQHIGVYPIPAGDAAFQADLAPHRTMKSTARFPLDEPVPYDLIGRLVRFRVQEQKGRAAAKTG